MPDRDLAIERLTREVRDLSAHVADLTAKLATVEARQPPAGWSPVILTNDAEPIMSMCRDMLTGRWAVRTPGRLMAEGATAHEAADRYRAARK